MTDIAELLGAYVDGELDAENARAVERVIACDPHARAKVGMLRETNALLNSACDERYYARTARQPRASGLGRRTLWARRYGWVIVALLVIAINRFRREPVPREAGHSLLKETPLRRNLRHLRNALTS
jgi:anti-sigma factor RsiW